MSGGKHSRSKHIGLGQGEPEIDWNGTRYTSVEGSAADKNISIGTSFDPLKQHGIALTNTQACTLGVKVGQSVIVHDNWTSSDYEVVYYDNAGRTGNVDHFEISPALADTLQFQYRNKKGRIINAVAGSERMKGRFDIRKLPQR